MELSNKQKVISLLQAIGTGDTDTLSIVSPAAFVQHDPSMADGLEGYREWLLNKPSSAKLDVARVFEDGDFVFANSLYDFGEPKVGFDIFRFENGEVVEHWSNFQAVAKPNPSGHTLIDGPTQLSDLEQTGPNKALVRDFVTEHLMNGGADIARFFEGDNYIQHNPNIPDQVSGLFASGESFRKQGLSVKFIKVHQVLGQGNFVLAVSEGYFGSDHLAFYDLYRVENARIAEHWDILEKITPEEAWKNANGKF